ncbi:cupin domain-containing protein, partial [Staphylococcus aureus]|uniref:cupin domain-containing protein n=1 Tax=Staphylococcus aureus TaxID=1280 RepID=UPI00210BD8A9
MDYDLDQVKSFIDRLPFELTEAQKSSVNELQLESRPEGGFYRETIREVLKDGRRAPFSSIYFLLTDDNISHFQRNDTDEVWYYHAGDSLTIHMINPDGEYTSATLGTDIQNGDV